MKIILNPQIFNSQLFLSHPDSNRRYRNFTDSVLSKTTIHYGAIFFEESRTITAGREFHPAPSVLSTKINKKIKNERLKAKNYLVTGRKLEYLL